MRNSVQLAILSFALAACGATIAQAPTTRSNLAATATDQTLDTSLPMGPRTVQGQRSRLGVLTLTCTGENEKGFARRCRIPITAVVDDVAKTCKITAPDVEIPGTKRSVLVFDLPSTFHFCPALGDGAFLVNPGDLQDDQFDDFGAPDDGIGGSSHKRCRNVYRWLAENSKAEQQYDYRLQFRRKSDGFPCTVDPWIKNGK